MKMNVSVSIHESPGGSASGFFEFSDQSFAGDGLRSKGYAEITEELLARTHRTALSGSRRTHEDDVHIWIDRCVPLKDALTLEDCGDDRDGGPFFVSSWWLRVEIGEFYEGRNPIS
jgi:hypothetical protein